MMDVAARESSLFLDLRSLMGYMCCYTFFTYHICITSTGMLLLIEANFELRYVSRVLMKAIAFNVVFLF